jgi:hypothetical protein
MWKRIQNLTIDDLEKLSEAEQKEIEEYRDPVIEARDNIYTEEDKKKEMEEEVNTVKAFWNTSGGENGK